MKSIMSLIILFVLALSSVGAKCGTSDNPCDDWKDFDYSNPKADIKKVPPDKIDVHQAILYGRGKEITLSQLGPNLENIDNLNDVNVDRARKAIYDKYKVRTEDFGQSASIKGGILQANFGKRGKATISNPIFRNGILTVNKEGEILFIARDIQKLEIPSTDKITVNVKDEVSYESYKIKGEVSFDEGHVYVKKGSDFTIDDVNIKTVMDSVNICNSLDCSGNYVKLSNGEFSAEGNGFKLTFLDGNKYIDVKRNVEPKENQNDFFSLLFGDFKNNKGTVFMKLENNQLPKIYTKGSVTINNDENIVIIENDNIYKSLIDKTGKSRAELRKKFEYGSVPAALFTKNSDGEVYVFDNNHNLRILSSEQFIDNAINRRLLKSEYGVNLNGYFSRYELDTFIGRIRDIEDKFGIDFNKLKLGDDNIWIEEADKRLLKENTEARIDSSRPPTMEWSPIRDLGNYNDGYLWGIYDELGTSKQTEHYRERNFPHEMGHMMVKIDTFYSTGAETITTLNVLDGDFNKKWVNEFDKLGVVPSVFGFVSNKGESKEPPSYIFPSDYSRTDYFEHQAEVFLKMNQDPQWFEDQNIPEEQRKQRQAFRDIYLEELKKYKK